MTTDIAAQSFWDKFPRLKPYALLARWDRPIGVWLCLFPALWGLTLAPDFKNVDPMRQLVLFALFIIGAIAVRGAGCTINDLTDRKLDAQVERTKQRPLASGQISVKEAVAFLIVQAAIGAAVLFQLSPLAIDIGLCTIPLIAVYPWMKRITWWPQAFLGIVFNSGALIGWATVENSITHPAILLYLAAVFWTIGYDTIYAHMDVADDSLIGIKSTARLWGPDSKTYIGLCFAACIMCFTAALALAHVIVLSYVMVAVATTILIIAHLFWNPDNNKYSLAYFRIQAWIGFLLMQGAMASVVFQ